jgi:hypothetical protein
LDPNPAEERLANAKRELFERLKRGFARKVAQQEEEDLLRRRVNRLTRHLLSLKRKLKIKGELGQREHDLVELVHLYHEE